AGAAHSGPQEQHVEMLGWGGLANQLLCPAFFAHCGRLYRVGLSWFWCFWVLEFRYCPAKSAHILYEKRRDGRGGFSLNELGVGCQPMFCEFSGGVVWFLTEGDP